MPRVWKAPNPTLESSDISPMAVLLSLLCIPKDKLFAEENVLRKKAWCGKRPGFKVRRPEFEFQFCYLLTG